MRKFDPLNADHPLVGSEKCAACKEVFQVGDIVTLIALGPGNDEEERAAAQEGRAYNAVAAPVHWLCAATALRINKQHLHNLINAYVNYAEASIKDRGLAVVARVNAYKELCDYIDSL